MEGPLKILEDRRGVALVLVLWITTLLTIMVNGFIFAVRTESRSLANYREETDAYYLARSGLNIAMERLLAEAPEPEDGEPVERWIGDGRIYRVELSKGYAEIRIFDESAKVDLNAARREDLVRTLTALGVEDSERDIIADSILDWRDENNFHRLNGAEDDYYESLKPGYGAKDAPFDAVDELNWVRGVTGELFFGDDTAGGLGLRDVFTVFTGSYRININRAPYEVLLTLPGMDEKTAGAIIEAREAGEIQNMRDYTELGGRLVPGISTIITFTSSDIYTIESTGRFNDNPAVHTIRAVVKVKGKGGFDVLYWKDRDRYRRVS